jgi:predicted nucleic acid-binding protein
MIRIVDTSALKWAYLPGRHRFRMRQVLARANGSVYIAEITVLEIVNAFGGLYRDKKITLAQCERADHSVLEDIASQRLLVLPFPASEYVQCRHLLALAGIHEKRFLSTQDAIIACTARQLALDRKEKVKVLTSDKRLAKVISDLDHFAGLVVSEYLTP